MNSDRYKEALEEINDMATAGRKSLSAKRIAEIIRRAFHPKETCPQCNGTGEIPQQRTPDCGDCVHYKGTGPYSGECHAGHRISDETDSVCYTDFVNRFPMEKCPSCNGESTEYEEDELVAIGSKHDFFGNIDLEDNPPTMDEDI